MIDLALQSASQATIYSLLAARNLAVQVTDEQGMTFYAPTSGIDWCWWADSGKLMTASPVLDKDGNVTTPPTFLSGFVMLLRITDIRDKLTNGNGEQWSRSKVAKYIKDNGVLGTIGGISCYTISNVRMVKASDLFQWLANNNLPGHEWAGGNTL